MTTITITKTVDDIFREIECNGHSGYAESGEDIVCAAISVLTINTINSIEKLTEDNATVFEDEDSGIIRATFEDIPSKEADLLLKSFELGVTGISKQYSKYLNIKFRRV